jgi:hypothetical protein
MNEQQLPKSAPVDHCLATRLGVDVPLQVFGSFSIFWPSLAEAR